MISIQTQHFTFHRILLLAVGLWPYQQSRLVQFQLVLFFSILISFIIFELTVFISAECTPDFVIKVLSVVLLPIIYAIEYNSFRINVRAVQYLLEQLQHVYNQLKDENEIAIMKKYGRNAKHITIIFILLYICASVVVGSVTILPHIFRFVLYINVTQPHVMTQLLPGYFSARDYFYMLLYMDVASFIGETALIGAGLMLLSLLKHICGIFKIASYRIEKAITVKTKNIDVEKKIDQNEIIIYKKIIDAVDIHREAVRLIVFLSGSFQKSHLLLILILVICLSLNLYAIAMYASNGDFGQLLIHFLIAFLMFIYMFCINYAGQEITNHNDHVFSTVYNVQWYITPLHVQKLILFLLQKGSKTFNMNFGGVIILSFELFATLTKASLSYFTVMYSMQEA